MILCSPNYYAQTRTTRMDAEPAVEDAYEHEAIDKDTQQRYRVFKKNSPYLYEYLSTHSLLWPSLCVQFFPDLEIDTHPADTAAGQLQTASQRLLFGTFTLGQAEDAIHIHRLPHYKNLRSVSIDQWSYNADKEEFELPAVPRAKARVLQTIPHRGDVNKLQYMPQNPDLVASANNFGDLCIYNRTKHSTIRKLATDTSEPQLRLANPAADKCADIFAFDWNKQREGTCVAASMDGHMSVYDVRDNYSQRAQNALGPSWTHTNTVGVNDVDWVPSHSAVFVAADDGGAVLVCDTRVAGPVQHAAAQNPVNSVSVHPHNAFCLASGDAAGNIDVWDLRQLLRSSQAEAAHGDAITQVKWHPRFASVLGLSSSDRLVWIRDVAHDELLFSHEGHMLGVNDFDWLRHEDWMVASVADDNSLHVWQPLVLQLKYRYS